MFESVASQTSVCVGCPKMCRHTCPVSNAERRESVTPAMKMSAVDLMRRSLLPVVEETARAVEACTGCGGCSEFCLLGVQPAEALMDARRELATAGALPVATRAAQRMRQSGNPTGADLTRLHRERIPVRPEQGSLALWPGCTSLRRLPEHESDTLAALEKTLGHTVAVVPPEPTAACCGYPLYAAGLMDAFSENARRVAQHVAGRGTLVTADAGCAWTFQELYPRVGVQLDDKVRHSAQVMAGGVVTAQAASSAAVSLYHDPCHLGRRLGVMEEPRSVLARAEGRAPMEFTWNRSTSECCGGGGLYPWSNPQGALEAARRRVSHEVDEMQRTGATRVVTACPTCEVQLGRAGSTVVNLARVVLGRAGPGPRTEGRTRST